jgi:hypothetical protein
MTAGELEESTKPIVAFRRKKKHANALSEPAGRVGLSGLFCVSSRGLSQGEIETGSQRRSELIPLT